MYGVICFFFFKQKTAYEMRISDWSSDVCSSDLLVLARAVAMIARGVPEVMWAFLFIAFLGPGLVAGTMAIAAHTVGVLTRVFSEAVDNQPLRRFEPTCGASRRVTYAMVAAPLAWRAWMTRSEEHTSELQSLMRIPY